MIGEAVTQLLVVTGIKSSWADESEQASTEVKALVRSHPNPDLSVTVDDYIYVGANYSGTGVLERSRRLEQMAAPRLGQAIYENPIQLQGK